MKKYRIFKKGLSFRERVEQFYLYIKIIFNRIFYQSVLGREKFWDNYSDKIYRDYGNDKIDYDVLEKIICLIKPNKILDIGCGNGRVFPIYFKHNIKEIVGQDISKKALSILRERFPDDKYITTNIPIQKLDYSENYFDLIISNRIMQSLPKQEIKQVIKNISTISEFIYLNEASEIDKHIINSTNKEYILLHDYEELFNQSKLILYDHGYIDSELGKKQLWQLYKKK